MPSTRRARPLPTRLVPSTLQHARHTLCGRVGTQTCRQLSGSAAQGSITARHQGFTEEERPWRQPSHFNARNLIVAERLGYTLEVPKSNGGDTKPTVETRAVEINE